MAPKRSHKKSRNGCNQCKARRVKCQENRPTCTNCARREIACHYSNPLPTISGRPEADINENLQQTPSLDATTPLTSSASVDHDLPEGLLQDHDQSAPRLRLRELALMQHWCRQTYRCFEMEPGLPGNLFHTYVVKEALEHEYLLDFIFALTSLHIASEMEESSAASYIREAHHYQARAVPVFLRALENIGPSNCAAVFVSSILTSAVTLATITPLGIGHSQNESPIETALVMFDLVKGIRSITEVGHSWLEHSPLALMLSPERIAQSLPDKSIVLAIDLLRKLNSSVSSTANQSSTANYEHAINQLEICSTIGKAMTLPWLAMVGDVFISELRRREPIALVIFMYWSVLLVHLDELWWAKSSGRRLIEDLSKFLPLGNNKWDEATRWALSSIGVL